MDGRSFAKITKDCKGLIDSKKLTPADVDLVFAKVKKNGLERKICFSEFLMAVEVMGQKKGVSGEEMGLMITMSCSGGPILKATKADDVRFHDDKSLYTGVYAHGGPTSVDSQNPVTYFGSRSGENEEQKHE